MSYNGELFFAHKYIRECNNLMQLNYRQFANESWGVFIYYICVVWIFQLFHLFCYSWTNSNLLNFFKNLELTDGYKCKSFKSDYCCKLKICANLNNFLHAFYFFQFVHVLCTLKWMWPKKSVYTKVCLYSNLEVEVYTVHLNIDFLGESSLYQKTFRTLFT